MKKIIDLIKCHTGISIQKIEPLDQGYTEDSKYLLVDDSNKMYLLRQSKGERVTNSRFEQQVLKKLETDSFPTQRVVSSFEDQDSYYLLLTWIKGIPLDQVIDSLDDETQYQLGVKAGSILKKIHTLLSSTDSLDYLMKRKWKELIEPIDLKDYQKEINACYNYAIKYFHDLEGHAAVIEHSDFHLGNLIYHEGDITCIDFNGSHVGIIYDEFYKLELFDYEHSLHYINGFVDTYTKDLDKTKFFRIHKVLLAIACLNSIRYGLKQDKKVLDLEIQRMKRVLINYQNFEALFPSWLIKKG